MKTKLKFPDIVILTAIASSSLYIVFRNLGREAGSFTYLWAPLALVIIISSRPETFQKGPIKVLLAYGVIIVGILQYTLWIYMDEWNRVRILQEFYHVLVMTVIFYYYKETAQPQKLALISKYILYFVIITLIGTNIALNIDPYIVRQSAASGDFTSYQGNLFKLTGAMGYSYAQGIICIIPLIIYHIKNKRILVFNSKTLSFLLVVIIITQIRSQVFANILVTIIITFISILGSEKLRSSIITITIIVLLYYSIPVSFYIDILHSLSTNFEPGSELNYKILDLANYLINPVVDQYTTGVGARADRYPMLINALVANPLFGNASYNSTLNIGYGAHLFFMNRLALWGVLGFCFYLIVLYNIFRDVSLLFDDNFRFYYYLSILAMVLMGLSKALQGTEPWLFLIIFIPGIYYLPLLKNNN